MRSSHASVKLLLDVADDDGSVVHQSHHSVSHRCDSPGGATAIAALERVFAGARAIYSFTAKPSVYRPETRERNAEPSLGGALPGTTVLSLGKFDRIQACDA